MCRYSWGLFFETMALIFLCEAIDIRKSLKTIELESNRNDWHQTLWMNTETWSSSLLCKQLAVGLLAARMSCWFCVSAQKPSSDYCQPSTPSLNLVALFLFLSHVHSASCVIAETRGAQMFPVV